MRFLTLRSFLYSLALHVIVITALVVNFDRVRRPVFNPQPRENIVEAVTVDDKAVEKELQRLRELELEKQRAMEKKLKDLERQTDAVEKKRKQEEKRRTEAEQKRKEEERKTAAERERIKQEKRKAEADLNRIEEENRKAEAERQRIEQEKRKAEEEQKRKQEEKKKMEDEVAMRKQLEREQRQQDNKTLQNIVAEIYQAVTGNFNKTGLPKGLECVLSVQTIPGGEVISVTVNKTSGNEVFDRRAVTAVEKASPLPLPADPAILDRLRLRKFNFRFKPKD